MASSWKFTRDSFMNCDEFLWAWNLNLVHGLYLYLYMNCGEWRLITMASTMSTTQWRINHLISKWDFSELDYQPQNTQYFKIISFAGQKTWKLLDFNEQFVNIHGHQHELSLSTSWTFKFKCCWLVWFIIEPPEFLVVHEQPQFRERLIFCSGTFVNSSWAHQF